MTRLLSEYDDSCEVCGATADETPLVLCEGVIVCGPCAKEHGHSLAQYRDQLQEDLRK